MHRSQVSSSSTSRSVQPKPGAWAIRKSSTNRISPFSRKEITQLLNATSALERKAKSGTTKKAEEDDGSNKYTLKRRSSKILSTIKARLEKDSHIFNAKMKELEPTIKSLTLTQATPILRQSKTGSRSRHAKRTVTSIEPMKTVEKDHVGVGLLAPPKLDGEKLVTVGGYIVSLQEASENIVSIIKPRVSSDKDGLELEIKILGCNPMDIKFEKRYDTLIVIGINSNTLGRFEESKFITTSKVGKEEKDASGSGNQNGNDVMSPTFPSENDYMEEIHEIINIFVPKNVSLNQIFISKPDTKGRIFVKGP